MADRLDLESLLRSTLGSNNVYFQPPPSVQMVYPCIVYHRSTANTRFANNYPYSYEKAYQITVMDRNPDSIVPDKIAALPKCVFNTHFTKDGLNHDVFSIFF